MFVPVAESEVIQRVPVEDQPLHKQLAGVPEDRVWHFGLFKAADLQRLRHVFHEFWNELSEGSGDPRQSARSVAAGWMDDAAYADRRAQIVETARSFDAERSGFLILGANDIAQGDFVVLDGNHRLTAIILRQHLDPGWEPPCMPAFVAVSKTHPIYSWKDQRD